MKDKNPGFLSPNVDFEEDETKLWASFHLPPSIILHSVSIVYKNGNLVLEFEKREDRKRTPVTVIYE